MKISALFLSFVAMLAAAGGSDRRIFELAAGMENIIRV